MKKFNEPVVFFLYNSFSSQAFTIFTKKIERLRCLLIYLNPVEKNYYRKDLSVFMKKDAVESLEYQIYKTTVSANWY